MENEEQKGPLQFIAGQISATNIALRVVIMTLACESVVDEALQRLLAELSAKRLSEKWIEGLEETRWMLLHRNQSSGVSAG